MSPALAYRVQRFRADVPRTEASGRLVVLRAPPHPLANAARQLEGVVCVCVCDLVLHICVNAGCEHQLHWLPCGGGAWLAHVRAIKFMRDDLALGWQSHLLGSGRGES